MPSRTFLLGALLLVACSESGDTDFFHGKTTAAAETSSASASTASSTAASSTGSGSGSSAASSAEASTSSSTSSSTAGGSGGSTNETTSGSGGSAGGAGSSASGGATGSGGSGSQASGGSTGSGASGSGGSTASGGNTSEATASGGTSGSGGADGTGGGGNPHRVTLVYENNQDCVELRCPEAAPYLVACDIEFSSFNDEYACIAAEPERYVFVKSGDSCEGSVISAGSTITCASDPLDGGLSAEACQSNKTDLHFVDDRCDCKAASYIDGCDG